MLTKGCGRWASPSGLVLVLRTEPLRVSAIRLRPLTQRKGPNREAWGNGLLPTGALVLITQERLLNVPTWGPK
jgi:hypothetical protein